MGKFFKNNKWIGSHDRREIAEFSYSIFRSFEKLKFLASNIEADLSRTYVLIALKVVNGLSEQKICELFSGKRGGPSQLTDFEKKLLDQTNRLLSKPGGSVEFLKDYRAQDSSLSDVRENLSTEATQKLPKGRWLKKKFNKTMDFPKHVLLNYPEWMTKLLKRAFTQDRLKDEMLTLNEKAPTDLRINTLKSSKAEVKKILIESGISVEDCRYSINGLRLQEGRISRSHRVIADGLAEIQDEGSQLVAELCNAAPGDTVVDFCAGAGGKTLAIAASMKNKGRIFALDKYEKRLENAKIRFRKANVNNVFCQQITTKWIKRHFECADIVLVDAPCSGTGTWRRNPDMRAKFTQKDLQKLMATQTEILESAHGLVKKGGRLIYATCSILKEENERQIENFLNNHREFVQKRIGDPPENYLKLTPFQHKTDGFFVAILEKVAQIEPFPPELGQNSPLKFVD
jgi:16S rRNA (cytosine967-C5)-methyltransferase